jgi:hypothetical protein
MRAFEFKLQQSLHEQESSQIKKDIDAIIRGVKQNPENADIVAKKLAALNDAIDKMISVDQQSAPVAPKKAVPKPQVKPPIQVKPVAPAPQVNPAATSSPTAQTVESLDEAKQSTVNIAVQQALELKSKIENILLSTSNLSKQRNLLAKLINDTANSAVEQAGKEFVNKQSEYSKVFKTTIEKLAAKIDGELEKIAGLAPFNTEQPGIPLKDTKGKITAKHQKNLETVKGKITTGLNGVFSEINVMGFTSGDEVKAAINEFLNDMIIGVVDFGDVLKQKKGNIETMFKTVSAEQGKSAEYLQVFEKVKDAMWNTVIDIGKGTNMGPGELGLALILQPANKSTKGDLGYGDQTIELKGSRDPKSGARLGLEMGNKSRQESSYQSEILNKYFPRTKPKYIQNVPTGIGGTKKVSLNLTSTGIAILNTLIKKENNFNTGAFLLDSILLTLDGNAKDKAGWQKTIEKSGLIPTCINSDNTIDYNKWVRALTLIQYQLYGGESGRSQFKTIMVFSPTSTNFRVINNTREFGKAIDDGQAGLPNGIVASGGLSFNLDKFAKTPQVGIK